MKKLSFHAAATKRGTIKEFFAVPNENADDGQVTGIKVFRELLDAIKADVDGLSAVNRFIYPTLLDMAGALTESEENSRSGAARTVLSMLGEAVSFMAKNANFEDWLDAKLIEAEEMKLFFAEREAKEKAEFIARMTAGKAAKRITRDAAIVG